MKLRVFLFEDEEVVRHMISLILEKRGYEAVCYDHPRECATMGIEGCGCGPGIQCTDVILCDRFFHGEDCMSFIKNQRERGCKAKHIALMSAALSWVEKEWAAENGVHVLIKPFAFDTLDSWLDECEAGTDPDRKLTEMSTYA